MILFIACQLLSRGTTVPDLALQCMHMSHACRDELVLQGSKGFVGTEGEKHAARGGVQPHHGGASEAVLEEADAQGHLGALLRDEAIGGRHDPGQIRRIDAVPHQESYHAPHLIHPICQQVRPPAPK